MSVKKFLPIAAKWLILYRLRTVMSNSSVFLPTQRVYVFKTATSTILCLKLNFLSPERYELNTQTELTRVFANSVTNPRSLDLHIRQTSITY